MKHLYLIQLEAVQLNNWQEFLIESDVAVTPSQQHLIARISANKLIESLGLTPIEKSLQDEKDKVFFSTSDNDQNIQSDKFVQIKNISEISAENSYDLFTGDDRPKVIPFDPLKTLYSELEMLPLDEFKYDDDGYYMDIEYFGLITDAMDQYINNFIKNGHVDDKNIRFN